MIDLKKLVAEKIYDEALGLSVDEIAGMIEVPADEKMGDLAFPCFRLAKVMRKAPQMIAADIAERIGGCEGFKEVQQVNAYVNVFIDREFLAGEVLKSVLGADEFTKSSEGEGRTVTVDFSSPNIAKPFHIGHIRSTVIGNAICNLYRKIGFNVVGINHLGDYGTQFGKMIVAYRKWGSEEELQKEPIKALLGYYTKFHVEAEEHPELNDEARETFVRLENGEPEEYALWEKFRELSLSEFNRVYEMLGITFDSYAGESFYSDKMPAVIEELKAKGLMVESEGANIVDLEEYGLGAALITKSDGSSLYATRDIATAIYRKNHYDFYKNIYVVASQQNLHFKQWKKVLELMGYEWQEDCVHVPFGLVSLAEGTMSTRHGRVVFLEDVLNNAASKTLEIMKEKNAEMEGIEEISKEVGIGAVIFQELSNNRIKDYVFNWDKILNFDGETGPYVQYTHARACSVLRKAGVDGAALSADGIATEYLASESAYSLIKLIHQLPQVVSDAAAKYEPSILTRHLVDVAQSFNKFYHDEHILVENEDERNAKLALVQAARKAICECLAILGIKAPERM